ncbi:MAG: hypothetical protein GX903_01410 [Spirochaetales bacterium]|nr:hypothetical protein [Spirochaetales bacterium]
MSSHYKIIRRRQDVGMRISALYRQQQLSIGILDMGTSEELINTIDWYLANMNCLLHVMTTDEMFEKSELELKYPDVTFICFDSFVSLGANINVFATECYATYFLIVRSDVEIIASNGSELMNSLAEHNHPAVITPYMLNADGELLPTLRAPYLRGKLLDPISFFPNSEKPIAQDNLYPLLGLGIYDRALFQRLRGFDEAISGEFYQVMDFGIRCFLFGYRIYTISDLALRFPKRHSIVEDRSNCTGMERCYTKALSVIRIAGKNVTQKWKPYVDKELLKTEVKEKQIKLQKQDFFALMKSWPMPDTENE